MIKSINNRERLRIASRPSAQSFLFFACLLLLLVRFFLCRLSGVHSYIYHTIYPTPSDVIQDEWENKRQRNRQIRVSRLSSVSDKYLEISRRRKKRRRKKRTYIYIKYIEIHSKQPLPHVNSIKPWINSHRPFFSTFLRFCFSRFNLFEHQKKEEKQK
jgi:hypothetical protein